jgi:hypothetical protein
VSIKTVSSQEGKKNPTSPTSERKECDVSGVFSVPKGSARSSKNRQAERGSRDPNNQTRVSISAQKRKETSKVPKTSRG